MIRSRYAIYLVHALLLLLISGCGPVGSKSAQLDAESNQQSKKFLLALPKSNWIDSFPELEGEVNVFVVEQDGTVLEPLVSGLRGFNFIEDVSASGKLLVSSFASIEMKDQLYGDLYISNPDGSNLMLLTDRFPQRFGSPAPSAMWLLGRDEAVFIADSKGKPDIFIANSDGQNSKSLIAPEDMSAIYAPLYFEGQTYESVLFWRNGVWDPPILALEGAIRVFDLVNNSVGMIAVEDEPFPEFFFSTSTDTVIVSNDAGNWLVDQNFELKRRLPIEGTPQGTFWSPNSGYLLMKVAYEDAGVNEGDLYLWRTGTLSAQKISTLSGLPIATWSPDEQYVAMLILEEVDGSPFVQSLLLDVHSGTFSPLFETLELKMGMPNRVHWPVTEMVD